MTGQAPTGRAKVRATAPGVRFVDRLAHVCITFGGIGTILSVALVCVFLVWVVLPLLSGADVAKVAVAPAPAAHQAVPLHQSVDEQGALAWHLLPDGRVVAFLLADGAPLAEQKVFEPASTTAVVARGERLLLAGADGTVRMGSIGFSSEVLPEDEVEPLLRAIDPGHVKLHAGVAWQRAGADQIRRVRLQVAVQEPAALAGAAIRHADFSDGPSGPVLAALCVDGSLNLRSIRKRLDLNTGRETTNRRGGTVALQDLAGSGLRAEPPDRLLLSGAGDNVFLLWNDGHCLRVDARDLERPVLAETLDLLPEPEARLGAVDFLIGKTTLLVGDSLGRLRLWFRTHAENAGTSDGSRLVLAREFAGGNSPLQALAPSERSRLVLCGHADGSARLLHGTSGRSVAEVRLESGAAVQAATLAPKEDLMVLAGGGTVASWSLAPGHPEVTLQSVLHPVWYEGYERPDHVWQSTSGTDDFEPKFGLWPLIFGTLKATLYCMLFGMPLALLAALYTSEFMHPRWKGRVKPLIELMASLPSVVLGFLAALVFAPVVERHLGSVLAAMVAIPAVLLIGGQAMQAMPSRLRTRFEPWRLPSAALLLPVALLLAGPLGDAAEALLFRGDLQAWLAAESLPPDDPRRGPAFGGWFCFLLPLGALAGALLIVPLRGFLPGTGRASGFVRLGVGTLLVLAVAAVGSLLLSSLGFDLRGQLVGTYVQRNSLVVGFVMGFAVIPIIYTIAEDALTAVPEHLRAASLGAGATPWQTAVRVVLPTAMSGIFSACMVGFGRAVGETMIVLMAAGNTPVLELNPFNGFRTLSANIAVELPEAVHDSTHFRMLFLAALVLFVMTFVLNTAAEVVRQRFRRRAYQL